MYKENTKKNLNKTHKCQIVTNQNVTTQDKKTNQKQKSDQT